MTIVRSISGRGRIKGGLRLSAAAALTALFAVATFYAQQKAKTETASKGRSVLFGVLNGGKEVEPIALIENGKIARSGDDGELFAADALVSYFKAGRTFTLIFGGSSDGTVKVVKQSTGECAGQSAEVTTAASNAKLRGFVMALATDAPAKLKSPGVRRLPTRAERAAAESLVKAEFSKQKISTDVVGRFNYHNLTAIDVDRDGTPELVGSFWVSPKANERATLFFIAERKNGGPYALSHSEFARYTPDDIMSGEAADLDRGIYHTLLLDYLDIDGDGVGEIIVTSQAFEGRNFGIYKRSAGKWDRINESYNYRCGY